MGEGETAYVLNFFLMLVLSFLLLKPSVQDGLILEANELNIYFSENFPLTALVFSLSRTSILPYFPYFVIQCLHIFQNDDHDI